MMFNINGILRDTDGEEKRVEFLATYSKCGFEYGNGYYLQIDGNIDGRPCIDRLIDVRYAVIDDFREYAVDIIKSIWSGNKGSWKFIERAE